MEAQMQQASYAVQVSAGEATALQTRLADSHTEVAALLHACQMTADRELEQTAAMNQLKTQLEAQWLELKAAAAVETESAENAAAAKCCALAAECEQIVQKITADTDMRLEAANRRTQ